jgi:CheY-like chemotaxis protein
METNHAPHLFLVDDDEDDKTFISSALRQFIPKAVITFFSNGKEVVQALQKHLKNLPDLIVIDLNMPVMCGYELLKWIKGSDCCKFIPVVMFSTSRSSDEIERCCKAGAMDYYCKPSEVEGYSKIARSIARRILSQKTIKH